ncbi:splicing factor U2af large subunit B [Phalaenopsis equestris]|uniref:splicing factor U2af large subunit B n=1 Tax=Phalaenopsis equestris TaxID=78828 RepID=UPI0009E33FB1|nr:splicing factor U2af large subunit B [Phalaenopsis equestris]XP_020575124.1 splicing factor U2af large subunit B [Phalaenopsis equestris]XP_020575125.1 splicing factor U2af large subunit B [Phalaenopsis equestris]XP_020575126.1 splicing factor U2af large subunit B [Phalaenopsis equestris]
MGRKDTSKERSRRNPDEGTSARTRAFSFDEIMSRRNKKLNSNTCEKTSKMQGSFENVINTFDQTSDDDRHPIRSVSKDFVKERFRREESNSKRERDVKERKNEKVKSIHGKIIRNKDSTDEKYSRHSSKSVKLLTTESEKASGKKRVKDFEENDKYDEHYNNSKRDRKNEYYDDYHSDDKGRYENDAKKYKKRESSKLQDPKYSEKESHKKYRLEPLYEDSRLRRRSRSLEYDRDGEMYGSPSHLPRKHAYIRNDQGESRNHNLKKKHSDGDRYKTSGDGGYYSGHHRKHRSGLGGYSPRKRKTESAVKTPSPTIRSPERKIATWDQLPSGTNVTNTVSIFTSFPLTANKVVDGESAVVVTPATTKKNPATSIDSVSVVTNLSIDSVQLTQATRPLRRLYIENLPSSASEKSVIDCLNEYLVSPGTNSIRTTRPCISCIINKDKAQGLVEFLTPEDATAALSFDGNSFAGSVLKLRRPKDFVEAASGVSEKTGDVVRTVSDVVIDSPYKIFVGGISDILSSKMFMEIVSSFGPLKAFRFNFNKELESPCAFLEYEDHSITSKACSGLNGLMLGGSILTAVRAFPDLNGKEDDASPPSYSVPPHAKPLLSNVTQVLGLHNVINQEDLHTLPENELEETLEDVRLECARFGTIKAVHLVRHSSSSHESKSEAAKPSESAITSAASESNVDSHIGHTEKANDIHFGEIRENWIPNSAEAPENVGEDVEFEENNKSSSAPMEEGQNEEDYLISKLPTSAEEKHEGNEEQKFVEERELESSAEVQAEVSEAFAAGCIIVEFQRKEAACIAAHCLHRRSYGDRTVDIEYIPLDFYLKIFSK